MEYYLQKYSILYVVLGCFNMILQEFLSAQEVLCSFLNAPFSLILTSNHLVTRNLLATFTSSLVNKINSMIMPLLIIGLCANGIIRNLAIKESNNKDYSKDRLQCIRKIKS